MTGADVPPQLAGELVGLNDAESRGVLQRRGHRRQRWTIELEDTLREVVRVAVAAA